MQIHQLQKSKWLKDKARRKGRWNATGTGNYSGKGLKGQKARSGHSMKPFFEWGQTSIVQRVPKARGFKRYYKLVKEVVIINLGVLDADVRIADTMQVTKQLLKDLGYIKSASAFVKVLGNGDYHKHIEFVDMDAFSASAKDKMANPGTATATPKKVAVVKEVKKVEDKPVVVPVAKKEWAAKKPSVKKEAVAKKTTDKPAAKKEAAPKKTVAKKPAAKKSA